MIDCCNFLVTDGANPEQKYAILCQLEDCLNRSLELAIKHRDHEEVSSITEVFSVVMPVMDEKMLSTLPTKMMAVMGMVSSLVRDI